MNNENNFIGRKKEMQVNATKISLIITTTDSEDLANQISHELVKNRMARCVQIDVVKSCYEWLGVIHTSEEYRLMIKCLTSDSEMIFRYLSKRHNYDVPEIIRIDVDDADARYLNWVAFQ